MDVDYRLAYDATSDTSPINFSTTSPFDRESNNDEESNNPLFIESQRELRTLLHDTARSAGPTRLGSPAGGNDEGGPNSSLAPPDTSTSSSGGSPNANAIASRAIVSTAERVNWLRNYIDEVSPWLDMFDAQHAFGRKVPILAATSAPLMYAILAISARQLELQRKLGGEHKSLQLYQESIRCLTPQLQARDPNILAACVILCCLEMMSASPKNWRRHLDGCAALFKSYGIHGFSSGIPQAVFWCYARMDVCAAIISEGDRDLVLAIESWLPPDITPSRAGEHFRSVGSADMYANYAVWLCARVCHLSWLRSRLHGIRDGGIGTEPFIHSWYELWTEVQGWAQNRPREMIELDFEDRGSQACSRPFPFLLFAVPCAISSNQLYHTACLLLLEMRPPSLDTRDMGLVSSSLWHAHRICGISLTNSHHGCLNNAIQPLWLAGKLLSHPTEHRLVVDLIKRIETSTGWSGTWRLRDLRELWGYDADDPSF